jgi:hypothetical protein
MEDLLGELRERMAVIESSLAILKRRHKGDDAAARHYDRIDAQLAWAREHLTQTKRSDSDGA